MKQITHWKWMAINWKSMYIFSFNFPITIFTFQEYYKISDARIFDGNGTLKQIKGRCWRLWKYYFCVQFCFHSTIPWTRCYYLWGWRCCRFKYPKAISKFSWNKLNKYSNQLCCFSHRVFTNKFLLLIFCFSLRESFLNFRPSKTVKILIC